MSRNKLFDLPELDTVKLKTLKEQLAIIEDKIEQGENVEAEIAIFHKLADVNDYYGIDDFANYYGSMSADDFIIPLLCPKPPKIDNLSFEEILLIINAIFENGSAYEDYFFELLKINVDYEHNLYDLIFNCDLLEDSDKAKCIISNDEPPESSPKRIFYL